MTGRDLATHLFDQCQLQGPCYQPHPGRVILPESILNRSDPEALYMVAHEFRHMAQHLQWPTTYGCRWFIPISLFLEWEARREALRMILPALLPYDRKRLKWWSLKQLFTYRKLFL